MSLFSKFFGTNKTSFEDREARKLEQSQENESTIDEQFIQNFKKNGGKFLYCENQTEVKDQFENILAENDWFEKQAICCEPNLHPFLEENNISYQNISSPSFLLANCEHLIADEGSILFSSKQIKQLKPNELPVNIVVIATTSQITASKSDGLSGIKNKYTTEYPTNITTIKYFKKAINEDFTQYGSTPKNVYLLLLENL